MTKTIIAAPESYVVVDVETTGLDCSRCEIVELAAARIDGGEITGSFSSLVKPRLLPIDPLIESLTGITSEMLAAEKPIEDVLPGFLDFVGDSVVVGHNVTFDARFIDAASESCGLGGFSPILVDTMRVSRRLFPELEHHTLWDTVKKCGEAAGVEPPYPTHRALEDVKATAFSMGVLGGMLADRYGLDPDSEYGEVAIGRMPGFAMKPSDFTITVDEVDEDNPFFGCTVCFTGKLDSMSRAEAMQAAVNLGAEPKANYSAKLDYLVVGSLDFCASLNGQPSSKLKKARAAVEKGSPLQIISEDFFLTFAGNVM